MNFEKKINAVTQNRQKKQSLLLNIDILSIDALDAFSSTTVY